VIEALASAGAPEDHAANSDGRSGTGPVRPVRPPPALARSGCNESQGFARHLHSESPVSTLSGRSGFATPQPPGAPSAGLGPSGLRPGDSLRRASFAHGSARRLRAPAHAQHLPAAGMGYVHRIHPHALDLGVIMLVVGTHLPLHLLAIGKLLWRIGRGGDACLQRHDGLRSFIERRRGRTRD
jgi:hypothetical protein